MKALEPPAEWNPDAGAALERFRRERAARDRNYWAWGAMAAGLAIAFVLAWPPARAVAQRFWTIVKLSRTDVVRVDWDSIPDNLESLRARTVRSSGQGRVVPSREEARKLAGFDPLLPRWGVLSGGPKLAVLGSFEAELDLRAAELRSALQKAGIQDERVPDSWDGARISVHCSNMVQAEYPEMTLLQARPFTVVTTNEVDLSHVVRVALRLAGVDSGSAERIAQQMAQSPGLLFGIPQEESVTLRTVALNGGTGTLLHDLDEDGKVERVTLLWAARDRLFLLSGVMPDELAIQVANSIE